MQNKSSAQRPINWKKVLIWLGSIILFIIILLIIGGFILQRQLPDRLRDGIHKQSDGVYKLDFDDMNVSLLTGSVRLENLHLLPDTGAYYKGPPADAARNLYEIRSASLRISGLSVLKLLFSNKIDATSITLDRPDIINMSMTDSLPPDSLKERTLYQKVPEFLREAKLKLLRVNDLSYVTQQQADTAKRSGKWSGLSIAVENISIDTLDQQDSSVMWFARDIKTDSKNVRFASADGLYKFTVDRIHGSTKGQSLVINNFKVIPQYPEIEFTNRMAQPGDRYDLVFKDIRTHSIDFKRLEQSGLLHLSNLTLEDAEVRVFHNKGLSGKKVDKTGNFPHIAIKKLGLPVLVDTLLIKNYDIYYKELTPASERSGTVFFSNLYGTLLNISNDSAQWKIDPWCKATFKTNFLGKVKLDVNLNLNIADKDGEFNYKGTLGKSNAKFYNQLLEPMALARADDGTVNSVNFSVTANRFGSNATVQMLYDDLKVKLLKNDGTELKKKGFLSFLANTFLVKNSNPRKKGEDPLTANINHNHESHRSFFNLMWKSVFAGLKVNLGIPL